MSADETLKMEFADRLKWVLRIRFGTLHRASLETGLQVRNLQRWSAGDTFPNYQAFYTLHEAGICNEWLISADGCAFCKKPEGDSPECCGADAKCRFGLPKAR